MRRAFEESKEKSGFSAVARAEEHASHMKLLENALKGARNQLAEQSRLLGDTQQRVELLAGAQQRMQALVGGEIKKRKMHAARCLELEAAAAEASSDEALRTKAGNLETELKRGAALPCLSGRDSVMAPSLHPLTPPDVPYTLT